MFSFKPRIAALAGVVFPLVLLGSVAPAHAIVFFSQITSPADPAYLYDNASLSPTFTISGTTDVSEVDVRCYDGSTPTSYSKIAEKVTVVSGAFSVSAALSLLPNQPCILRAVPTGDSEAHPPGTSDPFAGPRVARSLFSTSTESSVTYGYDLEPTTLAAYLGIESVGEEGLYYSYLFAPGTLAQSASGFYDNASLIGENQPPSGSATRSELQIDGSNAYAPDVARELGKKLASGVLPGTPSMSVGTPEETGPGEFSLQESDPIVKCSPEANVFPPTITSCKDFVSTGAQLNRTWQSTHGDRVALLTDSWSSTDGHTHTLDALYNQELSQHGEGAFEFPGASSFAAVSKGQTESLPAGPGLVYYKTNAATPDGGDLENPQLAIVYDTSPDGSLAFHEGSTKTSARPDFEMHYARTIPASGSFTLHMGFVTEYSLAAVRSLAGEVLATYPIPSPPPPPVKLVPPPPPASATQVGSASGANGKVSFKFACKGVAGQSCEVVTTLTTIEKLRGSKIVAITARRHRAKTRSKTVTVGAVTVTIPAGQTVGVTVNLNATGRKLLARYRRLPVHLSAVLVAGTTKSTVIAQNLTVKPKPKKKPKHHRGRH
ncbi:MAG: hypothetical protein WB709_05415 [Solirubrobacteraceae bacterium]